MHPFFCEVVNYLEVYAAKEGYKVMDAKTADKVENLWQNIMKKYMRLSQRSEYITAPNSGHYIHLTDEELLYRTTDSFAVLSFLHASC